LHSASLASRLPNVAAIEGNGRQYCPAGNEAYMANYAPMFRVRYGTDMRAHHYDWRGNSDWKQSSDDADYYRRHPVG
jgi:hypothetical protein